MWRQIAGYSLVVIGIAGCVMPIIVAGMALLAVNGLDLVYTTWLYLKDGAVLHDTEIWDTAEVTSWVNSLLWVPHHVASLAACVVGLMMLWQAGPHKEISTRQRVLLGVLAAMAFASASFGAWPNCLA